MNIDYLLISKYQTIRDNLRECGAEESIIAGGAIRDMVLNKPISDIDVFYIGELDQEKLVKKFTIKENPNKEAHSFYNNKKNKWKVDDIIVFLDDFEYPIQLINVKRDKRKTVPPIFTLQTHVEAFGCNLSKMMFGGDLLITLEAMQDIFLEQLTFTEDCTNIRYVEKLKKKYPEYVVDMSQCDLIPMNPVPQWAALDVHFPPPGMVQGVQIMDDVALDPNF